jgi:hypothetical protein
MSCNVRMRRERESKEVERVLGATVYESVLCNFDNKKKRMEDILLNISLLLSYFVCNARRKF